MKLYFLLISCVLCGASLFSQEHTRQAKWQQRADCDIHARLYPSTKILKAVITIRYVNNSPDTLRSIWMHIWPNAYKDRQTAYARQEVEMGKSKFYFSKEEEKGSISGLQFTAAGQDLKWRYHPVHNDILELLLNKPLLPGAEMTLSTPFEVKLPYLFSRSGYKNGFFAITQWYPKPAVYDVNGWNKMPYLDIGEFYSEYGDYKVSITVPERYIVASTGNLETEKELVFLDSMTRFGFRQKFMLRKYNEAATKTLIYTEKNIHDFAWFADTSFRVSSSFVVLDKDTVKTWFFRGNESRSSFYKGTPVSIVNRSVKQYSEEVGNYPYKQCSVVIGPLGVAAGMEYPGICVCNMVNPGLIKHEIGHNWFYGILGTNERRHAWMDESINSYYQYKFDGQLKGDSQFFARMHSDAWSYNYEALTGYLFSAGQGLSQPLNTSSEEFTPLNYGAVVYGKGPSLFAYLNEQLGDSIFTACIKYYYSTWKYRHPLPGDMEDCFEQVSGMNLDWFFKDMLNENYDVDIVSRKGKSRVRGSSSLDTFLMGRKKDQLNPHGFLPEKNYNNNGQRSSVVSFHVPFHLPRYNKAANINVCPIAGFNYYDKLYLGALVFNRTLFRKKYEYTLMPAYAIGTKSLVGYASLNRLLLLKNKHIYKAETGIQGQAFGIAASSHINQYYRVNPYLRLFFSRQGRVRDNNDKELLLSFCHTGLRDMSYDAYTDSNGNVVRMQFPGSYFFNYARVSYQVNYRDGIKKYGYRLNTEYAWNYRQGSSQNSYAKAWTNAYVQYNYAGKKKFIRSEVFAGKFIARKGNVSSQQFFISANTGFMDYQYQEALMGRSENIFRDNILGHQLIDANGNMRNVLPVPGSDKWMLAMNNEVCFPGILPFRAYADLGYFRNATNVNGQLVYNKPELYITAGILLPLLRNTIEVFIPVFQSKQFADIYKYQKFGIGDVIGFKLRLNNLHPLRKLDGIRTLVDDL